MTKSLGLGGKIAVPQWSLVYVTYMKPPVSVESLLGFD